jgi:hypothetical protein
LNLSKDSFKDLTLLGLVIFIKASFLFIKLYLLINLSGI